MPGHFTLQELLVGDRKWKIRKHYATEKGAIAGIKTQVQRRERNPDRYQHRIIETESPGTSHARSRTFRSEPDVLLHIDDKGIAAGPWTYPPFSVQDTVRGVPDLPPQISRVVFTPDQIRLRVRELGDEINAAYTPEDNLLVLGILKGACIFLADLVREIRVPLEIDFLRASSYGDEMTSSGEIKIGCWPTLSVSGRTVLLVEDIIDSSATLNHIIPILEKMGATTVEVCVLLHKQIADISNRTPRIGFEAPQEFLVGYGMGAGEEFRNLPYIGILNRSIV